MPAIAVLDSRTGAVLGLMNRFIFFARYARQYVPELFGRKSILKLANREPLVVDADVLVADLGATLLEENPDALVECFVVTRRGRYWGVGTGEALLQGKVKLLQAREQELSRALKAETSANAAKSDFLALMSHELRTPLNAIIGFSEVLGTEMLGPLGHPRYREYANDVHGAGRHLLALINDILDLSKAAAGKFELQCEEIVPADVITECLKLMRGKALEGGLRLSCDLAPGPAQPAGGPAALQAGAAQSLFQCRQVHAARRLCPCHGRPGRGWPLRADGHRHRHRHVAGADSGGAGTVPPDRLALRAPEGRHRPGPGPGQVAGGMP